MKIINSVLLCFALAFLPCCKVTAGQQTQLAGGTNFWASNITNTYQLYGDASGQFTNGVPAYAGQGANAYIDSSKSGSVDLGFSGLFVNPTTTNVTLTLQVASSEDIANWTNSFTNLTFLLPANTTKTNLVGNWHIGGAPPGLMLRQITCSPAFNDSTILCTNLAFKGFTKNGI